MKLSHKRHTHDVSHIHISAVILIFFFFVFFLFRLLANQSQEKNNIILLQAPLTQMSRRRLAIA